MISVADMRHSEEARVLLGALRRRWAARGERHARRRAAPAVSCRVRAGGPAGDRGTVGVSPYPHLLTSAVRGRRPLRPITCAASGPGPRGGGRRVRPCQPGTTCSTRGPSRPSARASRTTCSTRGFTNGGKRRGPVSHGLAVEPARTGWRRCAGSREDPGVDDPRCRANQHDRVLSGVKPRRYAPRGDGLDTGCAHGHRHSLPDSPGTLFSQEGPEFDVLTEHLGSHFTWPQRSLFRLPFPAEALPARV